MFLRKTKMRQTGEAIMILDILVQYYHDKIYNKEYY